MILWPQLSKCLRTHIKKLNRAPGKIDDEMIVYSSEKKIFCMACLLRDCVALLEVRRREAVLSRSGPPF